MGFDDIQNAAYISPPLTTVRQPLIKMGEIAARTLLGRIGGTMKYVAEITVEPELVVRKSTAPPRDRCCVLEERADFSIGRRGFLGFAGRELHYDSSCRAWRIA